MRTLRLLSITFIFVFPRVNAQSGDCPGEVICTTQNAVLTPGGTNEIDSVNCGCLPPSEAPLSHWYEICVSDNGTIAFAINPSGSGNNYDLAMWGPGSSCPTGLPIRCTSAIPPVSTNSNADKTGIGQGATDLSENGSGDGWVAPINATMGQCYILCINMYSAGNSNFNIQFDGSATVTCAPLPVELVSFNCSAANDGIELNWNCQTETNNSHFIIERTRDGVTYEFVERIDGAGTTSQPTAYTYLDFTAPEGTSYYRLTQVDYNGTETRYGPISCEYTPDNPTIMEIMNMNGQVVFSGITANYKQTFNEQNLNEGVYVIVLTRGISRQMFKRAVIKE